jgi:cardiolipin synthase
MIEVPVWVLAVLILAVAILGLMLWTNLRERRFRIQVPDLDAFEQALPSIAGMTRATLLDGNRVEILQNGAFFPALLQDIAAARETIHFESYVWWRGEICAELARAFSARAREGVEVRLMIDAMGSIRSDRRQFRRMRKAGVRVAMYHPLRILDLGQLNKRTHRKLAVFDGRTGYVFGHGVSRQWMGNGQDRNHWRDTAVRLQGPIVNAVQSVFAQHWVEESGEVLVGEACFPYLEHAGDVRMHVLAGAPPGGVSDLELLFKMAIATAQKELVIQNPYFVPDSETVRLLKRAVMRGVDIRIMLPGPVTDSPVVMHAGHRYFDALIACGIRIFEHQTTLIHQKVMVVDGLWSHIGSSNFDDRSFDINEEAGVGVINEGVAAELKAAFEEDLKNCLELTRDEWNRRCTFKHRMIDRACYLVSGQL